ncbi:MAG: transketolase family protein [Promethearchaeia archaeon]
MGKKALRDVFGDFLAEYGGKYKDVVVLDADLSASTRTNKFAEIYPDKFFNMGIAEQNMVGTAIGFAISGKVPVVSGFSIFTTGRAWEFIRLACHDNLNVKIITTHGGFVGEDGSTHHALEDINLMATLPNMRVLVPSDEYELIKILDYAFNIDGPFYIRLPRGEFPVIHDENYVFSLGKPDLLKEGEDICFIGCGYGTHLALETAPMVEESFNLSVKVLNIPSIKPIKGKELADQLKTIKAVLTIEENNFYNGLGGIISRKISEKNPKVIRTLGIKESFGQSGTRDELLRNYGLNPKNLIAKVKEILEFI